MRIVYMGSADFSLPSLASLSHDSQMAGVVTQPDRRAGRGRRLESNPVKVWAQAHGLEVFQPDSVNAPQAVEKIRAWEPDLIVVAAYGQILRPTLLELPTLGCINIHASLLPRWRGAAPIQAAILAGDSQTGITLMQMDQGMDTGPILAQASLDINPEDKAGSLGERLAALGADVIKANLPDIAAGRLSPRPQDDALATYAPMLKKKDGKLDFGKPADVLARQVRAYEPWPASFFFWKDLRIVVRQAHAIHEEPMSAPGLVGEADAGTPLIQTGSGALVLDHVQPAGKSTMTGRAFLNGARGFLGSSLQDVS
jgi:methionyl-tRNA formyltransferase